MAASAWTSRRGWLLFLLAEDKGWSPDQVKDAVAKGNSMVALSHKIPVHLTYFTATVDDKGKVQAFADVYGIDAKMASALFGKAARLDEVTADAGTARAASARHGTTAAAASPTPSTVCLG